MDHDFFSLSVIHSPLLKINPSFLAEEGTGLFEVRLEIPIGASVAQVEVLDEERGAGVVVGEGDGAPVQRQEREGGQRDSLLALPDAPIGISGRTSFR